MGLFWWCVGLAGLSVGRVVHWVGLSERRPVSRLFGWMNSWLLDGELVGVFVGKLIGVWVG